MNPLVIACRIIVYHICVILSSAIVVLLITVCLSPIQLVILLHDHGQLVKLLFGNSIHTQRQPFGFEFAGQITLKLRLVLSVCAQAFR
jgi:hypothetical protein